MDVITPLRGEKSMFCPRNSTLSGKTIESVNCGVPMMPSSNLIWKMISIHVTSTSFRSITSLVQCKGMVMNLMQLNSQVLVLTRLLAENFKYNYPFLYISFRPNRPKICLWMLKRQRNWNVTKNLVVIVTSWLDGETSTFYFSLLFIFTTEYLRMIKQFDKWFASRGVALHRSMLVRPQIRPWGTDII